MNRAATPLFALPEVEALLREELGHLAPHAARQPSGRALLLQPDAAARALPFDAGPLTALRLHARGDALGGDIVCSARALPIENEAFQLVFAQHIGDMQPGDNGLVAEIARVMKPGGRCLATFFLMTRESEQLVKAGAGDLDMSTELEGYFVADPKSPEYAVGYPEPTIREMYRKHGLKIAEPIRFGSWPGRKDGLSYQDILVATR